MDRYRQDLIEHLSGFVTGNRLSIFRHVLERRTRYITVLLEDIYQPQNASAVLRTCDCTGIQDVYIVEERNRYQVNPEVALGSSQWLSFHFYPQTAEAVASLKRMGYRIVATSPHLGGPTPDAFDLGKGKAAFLFGTELDGLTEKALGLAGETIRIPMAGFTESYNISVSAAIILYTLRQRLEVSELPWGLGEEEKSELLLEWLRTSVKMSDKIEKQFRKGS